jgi:hypothetical protein
MATTMDTAPVVSLSLSVSSAEQKPSSQPSLPPPPPSTTRFLDHRDQNSNALLSACPWWDGGEERLFQKLPACGRQWWCQNGFTATHVKKEGRKDIRPWLPSFLFLLRSTVCLFFPLMLLLMLQMPEAWNQSNTSSIFNERNTINPIFKSVMYYG